MKRRISVLLLLALLLTLLVIPARAAELGYVTDAAALLSYEEWRELEALCGSISDQYDCGVHIVTVDDFTEYGSGDVFEVTSGIYHGYGLGKGPDRNGLILLLSMEERDFALFVFGSRAEDAFNAYGQEQLEGQFLPYFGENDWYGGFRAYADTCGEYLALAAAGEPVRESAGPLIAVAIGVSFLIALLVVSILKMGMKNVRTQSQACAYQAGGLNLTRRHDQYTHTTQTRRKIESGSGASHARVGGGGSGRSGKF